MEKKTYIGANKSKVVLLDDARPDFKPTSHNTSRLQLGIPRFLPGTDSNQARRYQPEFLDSRMDLI